jgi:hypothetical protein
MWQFSVVPLALGPGRPSGFATSTVIERHLKEERAM